MHTVSAAVSSWNDHLKEPPIYDSTRLDTYTAQQRKLFLVSIPNPLSRLPRSPNILSCNRVNVVRQVYAVSFNGPGGEVSYRNRWMQTDRYKKQERSGKEEIVGKAVWTESSGGWLANLGPPGNPSNTR